MSDGAPRVPRSSPAHLVYKFGGAVQQVLDLVAQIDAKTLSDKQTQRVRKRYTIWTARSGQMSSMEMLAW